VTEETVEEICVGHLVGNSDSKRSLLAILRPRAAGKTYFISGTPNEDSSRLSAWDLAVLHMNGCGEVLNCDICTADERNKQCPGYRPTRVHSYDVKKD